MGEEVEIGLPSFLYPSPPVVTGRGQEMGSVCTTRGTCLCSFFLDCKLFYRDVSSLACVHTPNVLASFLPFFHVQVSLASPLWLRQRLHCLAALFSPPHNQHIHPSGLNATAVCVCVCEHTRAGLCVCECVTAISVRDCNATLPHILCLSLVCLEREKKRERD